MARSRCSMMEISCREVLFPALAKSNFIHLKDRNKQEESVRNLRFEHFVYENTFPKVWVLMVMIDCKSLSVIIDLSNYNGDQNKLKAEEYDYDSFRTADDYRNAVRCRAVNPIYRDIVNFFRKIKLKKSKDSHVFLQFARNLAREASDQIKYIVDYIELGKKSRRIACA